MSRGVVQDPVLTRSGTAKIAQPLPLVTKASVYTPVCSQFSGAQTATPDIVGSQ